MKDFTVAARYARALFQVTEKRGETARALEDLKNLVPVFDRKTRVGQFLVSPQVRLRDKREVIRSGLRDRTLPVVILFVDLLLRKKRITEFDTIVYEFEVLTEAAHGIQRARLVSAVPLTEEETARLVKVLEEETGKEIRMTTDVDASLIGGAYVRIGDRIIDRSVRTLLDEMREQLSEVAV